MSGTTAEAVTPEIVGDDPPMVSAKVIHYVYLQQEKLRVERDRYKTALERITLLDPRHAAEIARAALKGDQP